MTERPSAATADAIYDQMPPPWRRPPCGPGRSPSGSASRSWPPRTTRPTRSSTTAPSPPTRPSPPGSSPPSGPTATSSRDATTSPTSSRPSASPADIDTSHYDGYLAALEDRRRFFKQHGAVSADHSHDDVVTLSLDRADAARIYSAALSGDLAPEEATAFRRHMLVEMARMSVEDGLVMTLHPGVHRNHHRPTAASFGPDTGHDIPVTVEFTRSLQPLLEQFGTADGFHLVLFTLDETTFSREIAPLAGFYPSVYAGAPWWFLDAPEAVRRYRGAVTETAGFYRTSGFIDDTRAFLSIPARHDMSRRLDAGYLAQLVAEGRLPEDEALETAVDLVTTIPQKVFKL